MMAPAATAAASGAKAGAIDAASLFAADKAAATEAQIALAATAKKDGVSALAGLSDAVVKVSEFERNGGGSHRSNDRHSV